MRNPPERSPFLPKISPITEQNGSEVHVFVPSKVTAGFEMDAMPLLDKKFFKFSGKKFMFNRKLFQRQTKLFLPPYAVCSVVLPGAFEQILGSLSGKVSENTNAWLQLCRPKSKYSYMRSGCNASCRSQLRQGFEPEKFSCFD
jgi:hypothetical protein